MPIRAIIADDEPHLAAHLASRLQVLWPELVLLASAANGLEALERIESLRPDIAFLDIRMPGLSGLEVAERISIPCRLAFVTAYDQFAVDAFERAAVDYLLKPVSDERLSKTVARLRQPAPPDAGPALAALKQLLDTARPAPLRWIKAQSGNSVRLLAVEEICYFQATDKYTTVFTADAELLIRTSIRELQEQLEAELFWPVHRGTLVNVRQIVSAKPDALGRWHLSLRDRPETLAVSRSHAHLFRQM